MGRLILDVSSLLRWTGPAVGIARVENALAQAALRRPGTALACYVVATSGSPGRFRALNPVWRDSLIGWSGALDAHVAQARRGLRAWVPGRHGVVAGLERVRLTSRQQVVRSVAGLAQRGLLAIRPHQFPLYDAAGARIDNVPRELGLAEDLEPARGDTVFAAGSAWSDRDPASIALLKQRQGFRYAALCYDMIPVTHPRFYQPEVAQLFHRYWRGMLPVIDQLVVNAACIADDVRQFCDREHLRVPVLSPLPLGYDPPGHRHAPAALPAGLRAGGYALFVSTIEPRKGHAMLLRAWRRLLARGVPQAAEFRLVFVGRPGWMVGDVLTELADGDALQQSVVHLAGVADAVLDRLYASAAFCLYPSVYEGFGLPVIEAFARGKAVLASAGGATRETVAGLSPCLDPADDAAWERAIEAWILSPAAVRAVEARIAAGFAHPDWPSAAARILDKVGS